MGQGKGRKRKEETHCMAKERTVYGREVRERERERTRKRERERERDEGKG